MTATPKTWIRFLRVIITLCSAVAVLHGVAAPIAAREMAYVTQPNNDTVLGFDTSTNALVATIPVGDDVRPSGIAISPDGRTVYVTNLLSDTVLAIEAATGEVRDRIPVGSGPQALAITPDGSRIYVANASSCSASVIDTAQKRVVNTIPVGDSPVRIGVTPDGKVVYVGNQDDVVAIDTRTNTVLNKVRPGHSFPQFRIGPAGIVYAWALDAPRISVIQAATGRQIGSADIPAPGDAAFSPDGRFAYIPAGNLAIVDTATSRVTATIPMTAAQTVVISPDGSHLYVGAVACDTSGCDSGKVAIVDLATNTVTGTVPLPAPPTSARISPDGTLVYFAHPQLQQFSILDTRTLTVRGITTPGGSFTYTFDIGSVFTPDSAHVYLATDRSVSVVDTATDAVTPLFTGTQPQRLAKSADGRQLYVVNGLGNSLAIIDTASNSVTATVPVGNSPSDVAVSTDGSRAYVAVGPPGVLEIIDPVRRAVVDRIELSDNEYQRRPIRIAVNPRTGLVYLLAKRQREDEMRAVLITVDPVARAIVNETVEDDDTYPGSIAVAPDGGTVYFVSAGHDWQLSTFDTRSSSVVATTPVGDRPLALSPAGDVAYVSVSDDNGPALGFLDTATHAITATVPLIFSPYDLAVSTDGSRLYVPDPLDNSVAVMDVASKSVTTAAPLTGPAGGIVVVSVPDTGGSAALPTNATAPALPRAYVAYQDGTVAVLDGTTVIGKIGIDGTPTDLVMSADGTRAFVVSERCDQSGCAGGTLWVIDTSENVIMASVVLGVRPARIAVAPDGKQLYLSSLDGVSVLDTESNAVLKTIPVEGGAGALAVTDDSRLLLVTTLDGIAIVDVANGIVTAETQIGQIPPVGMALSADGTTAYVATQKDVAVVDAATAKIKARVPFPETTFDVALSPDGATAYVTAAASCFQYVALVDTATKTIRVNIPVAVGPYRVAVTSNGAFAYVAAGRAVSIVDTALETVLATVPGVSYPRAIGLMPSGTPPPTPSATLTVTAVPTQTPLPTATPLPPASIDVSSGSGHPGDLISVTVRLATNGHAIAGTQNDLVFDPKVRIAANASGDPDCEVNPAIDKAGSTFRFEPADCGAACTRMRALVFGINAEVIPDAPLYTCTVAIAEDAAAGVYTLEVSDPVAADPYGNAVAAIGTDGTITVTSVDPPSDHTLQPSEAASNGQGGTTSGAGGGCSIAPAQSSRLRTLWLLIPLLLATAHRRLTRGRA